MHHVTLDIAVKTANYCRKTEYAAKAQMNVTFLIFAPELLPLLVNL